MIQARKLNWPSLSENYAIWTTTTTINISSSPYTITRLEIPKQGKYAFQGVVGGTSPSDTDYAMINVLKNNASIFQAVSSVVARGNVPRYDVPFYTVCDCRAGDLVEFVLSAPTNSGIRSGTSISATLLY